MKRFAAAAMILLALSGCGIFRGREDKGPKTPLLGQRIPILTYENAAETDPGLASVEVTLPAPEANDAWAQPGGNERKVMGNLALGSALGPAWNARIAGGSNKARLAASPVVANGTVYVIDTQAVVHAFDAKSGAARWRTSLGVHGDGESSAFGGGVSFDNGHLYATTGVGDVVALDAATGAVQWKVRPAGPLRGAPTVANGQLYVITQDNQIFALNAADGKTVWNEAGSLVASEIFGVAAPSVAQGTVVAGFSSGELTAYRYENGRAVWQDALSRTSMSTAVASLSDIDADPVIEEGKVYAIGQGGRMVALDIVSGQRLWELNIGGISTPWVAGDWIFVVTDQAQLLCIARATGKVRWITQLPHWRKPKKKDKLITWTGPVLAGNRLVLANTQGELVNVDAATGKIGTKTRAGKAIYLSPVIANNTLYILDSDGRVSAWR
jgi:outer membrane protein assembly factor BamB